MYMYTDKKTFVLIVWTSMRAIVYGQWNIRTHDVSSCKNLWTVDKSVYLSCFDLKVLFLQQIYTHTQVY